MFAYPHEVVESLNRLAGGVAVEKRILRCLTTDFLGDWKWHRETLIESGHVVSNLHVSRISFSTSQNVPCDL